MFKNISNTQMLVNVSFPMDIYFLSGLLEGPFFLLRPLEIETSRKLYSCILVLHLISICGKFYNVNYLNISGHLSDPHLTLNLLLFKVKISQYQLCLPFCFFTFFLGLLISSILPISFYKHIIQY